MPSFHDVDLAPDQCHAMIQLEQVCGQPLLPRKKLNQTETGFQATAGQVTALCMYKFGRDSLPDALWQLRSLTRLFLLSGNLVNLSSRIGELQDLEELQIARNKITMLPEEIGRLSHLKEIQVDENELRSLPITIGNLGNLETLVLHKNPLESLPDTIGGLSSLQTLAAVETGLRALPESIGNLESLELLITGGQFMGESAYPASLGHLPRLKEIHISESPIETAPPVLFKPPALKDIVFRWNPQLTTVPEAAGEATQLEGLYLNNNHITALPEALGNLERLQVLMLTHNPLTRLPASWGNLRSLRVLWLDGTSVHGPWPAAENFPALEEVYLPGVVSDTAKPWVNALLARGCKIFWGPRHRTFPAVYVVTDPYKTGSSQFSFWHDIVSP